MADKSPEPGPDDHQNELEQMAEAMLKKAEAPMEIPDAPGFDAEFEHRLAKVEARAERVQGVRADKAREERRQKQVHAESVRGLGVGVSVAYTIIGLPLAGAAIGWFFDQGSETGTWKSVGVLVGAVLGVVLSIFIMNRSNAAHK